MRMLILSANTGQGHNSCAKAIQEVCQAHGDVCDIVDVFSLVSVRLSDSIAQSHANSYRRAPRLSNAGYGFLEKHPEMFSPKRLIYKVMSTGRRQIASCIAQGQYDTVVCTHVLAAMVLTAAVEQEGLQVRTAFVATDYSCTPGINGTSLDQYFIPHESLKDDFIRAGIPAHQIVPTGIPVQKKFMPCANKAALKDELGLRPNGKHLLIMCGSMGCGPIPQMLRNIAAAMPDDWEITVVCGTNEALKNELDAAYPDQPKVHIRGYERQMPMLLSSADLYLTKPGGLSTSEAAAAAVPMVFVDAVAGCEKNNLRYFVRSGFAVAGKTAEEAAQLCLELMEEPHEMEQMKQRLLCQVPPDAAASIWRCMSEMHTGGTACK